MDGNPLVLFELLDRIELPARERRLRKRQREEDRSKEPRLQGVFPK
jgi:hypothetical protein